MSPQQTIAHYRITAKLGEGGMGAVYRATDTKLNRDVAIKVLPDALANDPDYVARFTREAQVLASLNHPNIAMIHGIEQGAIVMELVEGENLHGPVPIATAIDYARQIATGLEAAHEKGVVHRDLKPANIKVTPDGVVKLLDFGLAKTSEASSPATNASPTLAPTLSLAMTQAGMILGTAAYMSPEQARGKPVDKRADIWAFGVVLFELLTGKSLFAAGDRSPTSLPPWSRASPTGTRCRPRRQRTSAACWSAACARNPSCGCATSGKHASGSMKVRPGRRLLLRRWRSLKLRRGSRGESPPSLCLPSRHWVTSGSTSDPARPNRKFSATRSNYRRKRRDSTT